MKFRHFSFAVYAFFTSAALILFSSCPSQSLIAGTGNGDGDEPAAIPPKLETLSLLPATLALVQENPQDSGIGFSPTAYNYTVTLPPALVNVSFVAAVGQEDSDAVITYRPGESFVPTDNSIAVITVRKGDLVTTYVISFTRSEAEAAKLSEIRISSGIFTAAFDENTHSYAAKLPYGVTSVTLFAEGKENGSYFTFNPAVTLNVTGNPTADAVTIGVSADGFSTGYYVVNFQVEEPDDSVLAGLSLSTGALYDETGASQIPFDGDTNDYIVKVYENETSLVLNAQKKNPDDAVFYTVKAGISEGATSVVDLSDPEITRFSITVNNGRGYQNTVYNFAVERTSLPQAALDGLLFTCVGISAPSSILERRGYDGTPSGEYTFDPSHTAYNFNFSSSMTSISIAPSASSWTLDGIADEIFTTDNPTASHAPVRITVPGDVGRIPATYTVFFVRSDPVPVFLSALGVTGGTFTPPFQSGTLLYDVSVRSDSPSVIITGTQAVPGGTVTYAPSQFIVSAGSATAEVTVSGGPDTEDKTYTLNITRTAAQTPRFTSLGVNGAAIVLSANKLVYKHVIAYTPDDVLSSSVLWTTHPDVEKVEYSLNGGVTWSNGASNDGITGGLTLGASQTKDLLVRLTTYDKHSAIYFIGITRAGNPAALLSGLTVRNGASECLSNFDGDTYNYNVVVGGAVDSVVVTPSASAGADIFTSVNGGANIKTGENPVTLSNLLGGVAQNISINVFPESDSGTFNTYKITVVRMISHEDVFNASGTAAQVWTAPYTGRYKFEVWGAQGGRSSNDNGPGGKGGYSFGISRVIQAGTRLYVFAGYKGGDTSNQSGGGGGWPFGGPGGSGDASNYFGGGGGGGSSFVSAVNGVYNDSDVLSNRLIVAGGGGGGQQSGYLAGGGGGGGNGAGANGGPGYRGAGAGSDPKTASGSYVIVEGGTQSPGTGSNTYSGDAIEGKHSPTPQGITGRNAQDPGGSNNPLHNNSAEGGGGGGGGYYGGGARTRRSGYAFQNSGGGGGSGWVSTSYFTDIKGAGGILGGTLSGTSNGTAAYRYGGTGGGTEGGAELSQCKTGNGQVKITWVGP